MQDFGYCCWPDRVAQTSIGLVDESITQGHGGKKIEAGRSQGDATKVAIITLLSLHDSLFLYMLLVFIFIVGLIIFSMGLRYLHTAKN